MPCRCFPGSSGRTGRRHPVPNTARGCRPAAGAARVLVARHLHAGTLGQLIDRIEELEAVVVHQEADRGAVRAAAEAVIELLGGRDRERGRALVMERAARGVFLALSLQRHAAAHHLDDVGAGQQVVDESVGDTGHGQQGRARCRTTRRNRGRSPCLPLSGTWLAVAGSMPAAARWWRARRRSSITAVISAPTKNTTVA